MTKGSMETYREKIDAARARFRTEYRDGGSYQNAGATFESFNIDVSHFDPTRSKDGYMHWHDAQVQVHGDENLRNLILAWLSAEPAGYAVNIVGPEGGIDVRSVAPTRRGAIVNWLFANGVMVTNQHTDDMIEAMWRSYRQGANWKAYCIKVHVHAAQQPGTDVSETPGAAVAQAPTSK